MKTFKIIPILLLAIVLIIPLLSGCKKELRQYTTNEYLDITYKTIDNQDLKMDILLPTVRKYLKNPVVFYFHGGYWTSGDKSSDMGYMKTAIDEIRNNGITVIGVNYRYIDDDNKFPVPLIDCIDAISFAVKNANKYDVDTDKMGSWGMSAGGHLSLMTGFASDKFTSDDDLSKYNTFKLKFVVDMCGPAVFDVDSTDGYPTEAISIMEYFIGGTLAENKDKYITASPSTYLKNNNPSLLIIHGTEDILVPIVQSETFYQLALDNNINAQFIKVENASHGFNSANGKEISPSTDEIFKSISDFIINNTK